MKTKTETKTTSKPTATKGHTLERINTNQILLPKVEMRTQKDEQRMIELMESIEHVGLIQPITVTREGNQYRVVAGARRRLACERLGHKQIDCIVVQQQRSCSEAVTIAENIDREDISHYDIGVYLKHVKDEHHANSKQLAKMCRRTESWVSEHLSINGYCDELKIALRQGTIQFGAARELARISNPRVQQSYVEHALRGGINSETARQWRVDYEASADEGAPAPTSDQLTGRQPTPEIPYAQCAICKGKHKVCDSVILRTCVECSTELMNAADRKG